MLPGGFQAALSESNAGFRPLGLLAELDLFFSIHCHK